ncbi:hypothetical protein SAMN05421786_112106, partial [Chryseobacterium ureilyticum]
MNKNQNDMKGIRFCFLYLIRMGFNQKIMSMGEFLLGNCVFKNSFGYSALAIEQKKVS